MAPKTETNTNSNVIFSFSLILFKNFLVKISINGIKIIKDKSFLIERLNPKVLIAIIIGILTNDKYKYFLLLVLFNIEKIIKSIVVIRLLIKVYLFNPINTLDKDNIHKASKRFLENSSLLIRLYIINNKYIINAVTKYITLEKYEHKL